MFEERKYYFMEEFLWTEKYRPRTIDDCILPERLKSVFRGYVAKKSIPTLMFTGSSGIGKTSVAKALCQELGINHMFINSSDERGIDVLRMKIKSYASTVSLVGGRKVIILDEADFLTPETQAALRGAIEEFSKNCTFILTCNLKSKLMGALHSRVAIIDFDLRKEERPEMAMLLQKRLTSILDAEKVKYDKAAVAHVITKYFPDYRRAINELQRLSVGGTIGADHVAGLSDVANVKELVKSLKEKNFSDMRAWVVANSDVDTAKLYRKVYLAMFEALKPETIPPIILILAKYQYQAAFAADAEINTVACFTELMVEGEFK